MNAKCDRCGEENPADIHTCTRPAGTNPNSWIVTQLFEGLPLRKLRALMEDGWVLNGVSIERLGADGVPRRGAATTGGMVLWWNKTEEQQAPVQKRPQNCGTGHCSCIECVMEPEKPAPCTWTKSPDPHMPDTFNATCGVVWTFTDGGPAENDVRFCPGCGGKVVKGKP